MEKGVYFNSFIKKILYFNMFLFIHGLIYYFISNEKVVAPYRNFGKVSNSRHHFFIQYEIIS